MSERQRAVKSSHMAFSCCKGFNTSEYYVLTDCWEFSSKELGVVNVITKMCECRVSLSVQQTVATNIYNAIEHFYLLDTDFIGY